MLLTIAVDAAHALFQAGRIPGDVVIDHDPAELEVDPLGRRVGADHETRAPFAAGLAEALDLLLALGVVHAAVDHGG